MASLNINEKLQVHKNKKSNKLVTVYITIDADLAANNLNFCHGILKFKMMWRAPRPAWAKWALDDPSNAKTQYCVWEKLLRLGHFGNVMRGLVNGLGVTPSSCVKVNAGPLTRLILKNFSIQKGCKNRYF